MKVKQEPESDNEGDIKMEDDLQEQVCMLRSVCKVKNYSHYSQKGTDPRPQMATVRIFGTGSLPRTGIWIRLCVCKRAIWQCSFSQ